MGFSLDDIRCPYCDGELNACILLDYASAQDGRVRLLCECWSGDLKKESAHHKWILHLQGLEEFDVKLEEGKIIEQESNDDP